MIVIDITPGYIHVLSGTSKQGNVSIDAYARAELPCDMTDGVLSDVPAAAAAVGSLLSSCGARGSKAAVMFSKSEVLAAEIDVPYEKKPALMRNIILSEMAQEGSGHLMDYTIEEITEGRARVLAYLSPREPVAQARELLKLIKKQPARYTVAPHCVLRAAQLSEGDAPRIVIDAGERIVNYYLLSGGGRLMVRSEQVFSRDTAAAAISNQISKLMQFQIIKYPGASVSEIVLIGDDAAPQLAGEISLMTDMTVRPAEAPRAVAAPEDFPYAAFACCVGALVE